MLAFDCIFFEIFIVVDSKIQERNKSFFFAPFRYSGQNLHNPHNPILDYLRLSWIINLGWSLTSLANLMVHPVFFCFQHRHYCTKIEFHSSFLPKLRQVKRGITVFSFSSFIFIIARAYIKVFNLAHPAPQLIILAFL